MKTKHTLKTLLLMVCIVAANLAYAATGGSIMGQVLDPDTKQPIEGATVMLDCKGQQTTFTTDSKGYYYASNLPSGTYTMYVSFMSKTSKLENILLVNDDTKELNASLGVAITMPTAVITGKSAPRKPLLDKFDPQRKVIDKLDIREMPVQTITQVIPLQAGVVDIDGEVYVHGSRADGLAYYIDGCKITGNPNVPICGVEMMQVYTGYIPAKYGDTNAGVVAIETRNFFTE